MLLLWLFRTNRRSYALAELYLGPGSWLMNVSHLSFPRHFWAQIPYFSFMVSKPCCPRRISCKKVKIPNHTMGVMSTPKAGGMLPRRTLKSGSVGHATMFQGDSFKFMVGYQERTTRHNYYITKERGGESVCVPQQQNHRVQKTQNVCTMAKDSRLRLGSNTRDRGCTHGSVSASSMPDDEARSPIIWRDNAFVVVAVAKRVATGANADAVASNASTNGIARSIFFFIRESYSMRQSCVGAANGYSMASNVNPDRRTPRCHTCWDRRSLVASII